MPPNGRRTHASSPRQETRPSSSPGSRNASSASTTPPAAPPTSATGWVKGRNYWSNANNFYDANTFESGALRKDDPRLITLFLTGYGTFTGTGNETFPIVSFGAFYVTGWGQGDVTDARNIEDPCAGNTPPPDLIIESGGAYVWGHFINTIDDRSERLPRVEARAAPGSGSIPASSHSSSRAHPPQPGHVEVADRRPTMHLRLRARLRARTSTARVSMSRRSVLAAGSSNAAV